MPLDYVVTNFTCTAIIMRIETARDGPSFAAGAAEHRLVCLLFQLNEEVICIIRDLYSIPIPFTLCL